MCEILFINRQLQIWRRCEKLWGYIQKI